MLSKHKAEIGATLIEVLVTALLLAIGLLGMASLQINTLRASAETSQRSQVIWMAEELMTRIRSNPDGVNNGYLFSGSSEKLCSVNIETMCADHSDGKSKGIAAMCSSKESARFDLWESLCGKNLGNGSASATQTPNLSNIEITCDSNPCQQDSDLSMKLTWVARMVKDKNSKANTSESTEQSINIKFRL